MSELNSSINLFFLFVWFLFVLISVMMFYSYSTKKIQEKKDRILGTTSQSFLNNKPCQLHSWIKSEIAPNKIVLKCKKCNLIAGQDN